MAAGYVGGMLFLSGDSRANAIKQRALRYIEVMKRKDIRKHILLLLLLLTAQLVPAQTFTLQGKVSDKDGNPIELASVMVVSQGKLSMTNLKGEFSMQLHSEAR